MPPNKKKETKFPRRNEHPVNLKTTAYKMLGQMAEKEDRPIKTQLERIVREEYQRFKRRNRKPR